MFDPTADCTAHNLKQQEPIQLVAFQYCLAEIEPEKSPPSHRLEELLRATRGKMGGGDWKMQPFSPENYSILR